MSWIDEHWCKAREKIRARHAALAARGLNAFGDLLGTDYGYKRVTLNTLQRVLAAYGSQRDDIGDSDLDNEQPISLNVYLTLGDIRKARRAVMQAGHRPADFTTRPRE